MKRILSIMISVMLIVMSIPMIGFAADVTAYAVGDNVTDGVVTNLSWKTSNTVTVEFDGAVNPATVNATTVTLTEKGGIKADVPVIVEATADAATIKLGKLRPLTDYVLTFDGVEAVDGEFAKTEIALQSASTDILEYWPVNGGRGAQGKPEGYIANTAVYNGADLFSGGYVRPQYDNHSEYTREGSAGPQFYQLFRPTDGDLGDITFEYEMRVKTGELKTGGVNKWDNKYYSVMTPDSFTLFDYTVSRTSTTFMKWRINFFRGSDGYYYGNGYILDSATQKWTKVGDDVKLLISGNPFTAFNAGQWWGDVCFLNLGTSGTQTIGSRKMTVSSMAATEVMDFNADLNAGKIYITFDQKMNTANSVIDIVNYDAESVEFTDAYNCVITLDESVALNPNTEYEISLEDAVADSGVIGGTSAYFTTPKSSKITVSAVGNVNALSWTEANTVELQFSGEINPDTFGYATVAFTEVDGTIVDIPWIIEDVTETNATIKIGKLKPLTDYKLSFGEIEPADPELTFDSPDVILKSASADITEKWYGERGLNGNASTNPNAGLKYSQGSTNSGEPGTTKTEGTDAELPYREITNHNGIFYGNNNYASTSTYTGTLYSEYKVRTNSGNLNTAGVRMANDPKDYFVKVTPGTLSVKGASSFNSANPADWLHYRVEQFKGTDGLYYGNVHVKTTDESGNLCWKKIASNIELTRNNGTAQSSLGGSPIYWWIFSVGANNSTASADVKKFVLSTIPTTGVMDYSLDLENNKINVTFDQKVDTNTLNNIKLYPVGNTEAKIGVSAVCEDGFNAVLTINGTLKSQTEYALDMSALAADSGVLGCTDDITFTSLKNTKVAAMATSDVSALSWKEANTVEIEFTGEIVPSSVTTETVTLTEKDGTVVDIPYVIDNVTANSATIKIGKLKALTDYTLTFDGVVPADNSLTFTKSEIALNSAATDIYDYWAGERGSFGKAPGAFTNSNFDLVTNATKVTDGQGAESTYQNSTTKGSLNLYRPTAEPKDIGNFSEEYKVRVNTGGFDSAGARYGTSSPDYMAQIRNATWTILGASGTITDGWVHYRVNFYRKADGFYYGSAYVKTTENNETTWKKVASDVLVTNDKTTTGIATIPAYDANDGKGPFWFSSYIGPNGNTNNSIDFKKVALNTLPATGVLDYELDLDNGKIYVMFDQKVDASTVNGIKLYPAGDSENAVKISAECTDGYNCIITIDEVLTPGTEYTVDMSAIKADGGVIGGTTFNFETEPADVEVTSMTIGDGLLTSSVTVKKNVEGSRDITIILALYDGGNSLVKAAYLPKTVTEDTITYTDVAITGVTVQSGYKAKLMVWEGTIGDCTPICPALEK